MRKNESQNIQHISPMHVTHCLTKDTDEQKQILLEIRYYNDLDNFLPESLPLITDTVNLSILLKLSSVVNVTFIELSNDIRFRISEISMSGPGKVCRVPKTSKDFQKFTFKQRNFFEKLKQYYKIHIISFLQSRLSLYPSQNRF